MSVTFTVPAVVMAKARDVLPPTASALANVSVTVVAAGTDGVVVESPHPNAVRAARQVIGATDPIEADAGSIRGEFGTEVTFNLVHGSDSPESAEREIGIWFPEL